MKNKGKLLGIMLPLVIMLVGIGIIVYPAGISTKTGTTAGEVLNIAPEDIVSIRVSQELYYLDDKEDALWTQVWAEEEPETVASIHEAISGLQVEMGDGIDDSLAGGSPRFVVYTLQDGAQAELRFVDDVQFWLDGTCWHFRERGALYETLDKALGQREYTKAPGA